VCQVYDIIWNPTTVKNAQDDPVFRQLMVEFAVAHIKQKKNHELSISYPITRVLDAQHKV